MLDKSPKAYRTIKEVADHLQLEQHVLRFWETKFRQIQPMKRAGGRRFYRIEDVQLLEKLKLLLREQGYTIKGVQKLIQEKGIAFVREFNPDIQDTMQHTALNEQKRQQYLRTAYELLKDAQNILEEE